MIRPRCGATQNSHSCAERRRRRRSSAGPVERAGFTEVLVTGMLTRWISVSDEADRERREAAGRPRVGGAEDHEQEERGEHDLDEQRRDSE